MADDPNEHDPLPIAPSLLRLPEGYESTGDPVDGNPFPPNTMRHDLWARVTRQAEEEISRIKSESLVEMNGFSSWIPKTLEEAERFNATFRQRNLQLISAEFQVWAGRGAQVVFTDVDVRHMDAWLVGYASAFLETRARHMLKHGLGSGLVEAELHEIRNLLAALVLHWKGEIRRCRAIREEEAPQFNAGPRPDASAQVPALPAVFPNRAEVSHQPTRQRERQMRRFKSAKHAQRFLSVHGLVLNLFRVGRHLLRAVNHRTLRIRAFGIWDEVTYAH